MCSGNPNTDPADSPTPDTACVAQLQCATPSNPDTDNRSDELRMTADGAYAPYGRSDVRDELRTRQQRATTLSATVIPIARGIYSVNSGSGSEYIVDLDGYVDGVHRAICECNDYRYRCGPGGYDCKHILLVKRLVQNGLLPPLTADPEEWLYTRLDYLERLITAYQEATNSTVRQRELTRLNEQIDRMTAEPYEREYRDLLADVTNVFAGEHLASSEG